MSKFDRFWKEIFTAPEAYNIDKIVDLLPYSFVNFFKLQYK